ncbi:hypothetical protein ABTI49_04580 [Acinetobacter baumannii]|uniref:Uncharacterized protein n=1 Tax=Acinetobacter baumannii TaxID=470 RepID=A0A505UYY6_ACIBA|nr:hypothetical protein [Acinetobacter baumannii]ATI40515.1 hypothetical protein BS103_18320 [Acinetobacter baumannii]AXX46958.1 hypothetical protein Aba10324_18645 [Acinetobacter baumannii]EJB8489154.1 hypothetical protein [Acinetobacter baumannii]EKU2528581.1 hypothetical protein [Acinetobacter baumannii]EKU8856838.1 hypothetical protein [Acinetobacter baumannii]
MSKHDDTVKKHWFMVCFKVYHSDRSTTEGFKASFSKACREINSKDINDICNILAEDVTKTCKRPVVGKNIIITNMFHMGEMTDAEFYEGYEGEK